MRTSMGGKLRFLDNIFVETLWRTLKHECVYLRAAETGSETKMTIWNRMIFYTHHPTHSAPGGKPAALVYWQRNDTDQTDRQVQRIA